MLKRQIRTVMVRIPDTSKSFILWKYNLLEIFFEFVKIKLKKALLFMFYNVAYFVWQIRTAHFAILLAFLFPRLTIMANSWIFIHDSSTIHGSPCHELFHDLGKISMIHGWFMDGNPWFMDENPRRRGLSSMQINEKVQFWNWPLNWIH